MLKRRISLVIALAGDGTKAPTELRLFAAGWTDTTKGLFLFDAASAESVMRAATDWGNRYSFDYQHSVIDDAVKPQDKKSAGSFLLELRQGASGQELWAVDIQWAAGVAEAIEAKEWLYFSPLFYFDETTRGILELINVALTNDPATKNMQPLLMAASRLEALGMSHEDIRAQLQSAIEEKMPDSDMVWNTLVAVYDDRCVYQRGDKFWQVNYVLAGSVLMLAGDPLEVRPDYVPVSQPHALSGNLRSPTAAGRTSAAAEKGSTMERAALIMALGLDAEIKDSDLSVAIANMVDANHKVMALTGADSVSAALGMLEGWKAASEALTKAQAEIERLTAEARERKVSELLAKGRADRKVTPAMEASLRAKGAEDPGWLEAHINALPVHAALAGTPFREASPGTVAGGGKKWAELTNMERHALKRADPETYNRLRAEAGLSH